MRQSLSSSVEEGKKEEIAAIAALACWFRVPLEVAYVASPNQRCLVRNLQPKLWFSAESMKYFLGSVWHLKNRRTTSQTKVRAHLGHMLRFPYTQQWGPVRGSYQSKSQKCEKLHSHTTSWYMFVCYCFAFTATKMKKENRRPTTMATICKQQV